MGRIDDIYGMEARQAIEQLGVSSPSLPVEKATMELYTLPSRDGIIAKIQPPREPSESESGSQSHVGCDIVLVIDVSGSMTDDAPVPGESGERNGLSVLDLVKHAARTIVETLNEGDRLGIVTFSSEAKVLQDLLLMNGDNKKQTEKNIESMQPENATNLWHGIREGLKLFQTYAIKDNKRIPAMMVLTDGQPNHMCPTQGYVPKLRSMGKLPATIHTFGFGYGLRSGLLKSIAEVSGGNYSFIPDAGMVGTVFVHAVANLQSTFAQHAVLRLTYPAILGLEETTGEAVHKQLPVQLDDGNFELKINLDNLQYGQSRDIYLRFDKAFTDLLKGDFDIEPAPEVTAILEYQRRFAPQAAPEQTGPHFLNILSPTPTVGLSEAEIAYHVSRSMIVSFLSSIFPVRESDAEHMPLDLVDSPEGDDEIPWRITTGLANLIATLPANDPKFRDSDPFCKSLAVDLCGSDPAGQISLALSKPEYYGRWGIHYLPSLAGAHAKQMCNSFKDPGPLMYGRDSPLFVKCRDRLDKAFDDLPAPKPSNLWSDGVPVTFGTSSWSGISAAAATGIHMSAYNRSDNPCFAGCVRVLLAQQDTDSEGEKGRTIRIGRLRAGMKVHTPKGPRKVVAVLKTPVKRESMCLVNGGNVSGDGGLLVTPYHPVLVGGRWVFPKDVAATRKQVRYTGSIYSVLLERDGDPQAHAIMVGGVLGVTLGHGLVGKPAATGAASGEDARVHPFFGSYDEVIGSLARLHRSRSGLVLGGGVRRSGRTGLVDGFRPASTGQVVTAAVALQRKVGVAV